MAATNADAEPFARGAAYSYFRALERQFIELRGAPFQLSPDDFDTAKAWLAQGVPLELATSVVRESIAQQLASDGELKRRLRYYQRPVFAAWKRARELSAPADQPDEESIDIASRLAALARALPTGLPDVEAWRQRIEELEGDVSVVATRLSELDGELLAAAASALDQAQREEIDASVARSLVSLGIRLPAAEVEAARQGVWQRVVRQELGLPTLSLFSPAAQPIT